MLKVGAGPLEDAPERMHKWRIVRCANDDPEGGGQGGAQSGGGNWGGGVDGCAGSGTERPSYLLENVDSARRLKATDASWGEGVGAVSGDTPVDGSQRWWLRPTGDGAHVVQCAGSGRLLYARTGGAYREEFGAAPPSKSPGDYAAQSLHMHNQWLLTAIAEGDLSDIIAQGTVKEDERRFPASVAL